MHLTTIEGAHSETQPLTPAPHGDSAQGSIVPGWQCQGWGEFSSPNQLQSLKCKTGSKVGTLSLRRVSMVEDNDHHDQIGQGCHPCTEVDASVFP